MLLLNRYLWTGSFVKTTVLKDYFKIEFFFFTHNMRNFRVSENSCALMSGSWFPLRYLKATIFISKTDDADAGGKFMRKHVYIIIYSHSQNAKRCQSV